MRAVSKKRAKRNAECREFRNELKRRVGRCEICGYVPCRIPSLSRTLDVHEICRGTANRVKALDRPEACLVVCRQCHEGPLASRAQWPEERQLAALLASRPSDFNLESYNRLVNERSQNRVTQEDVYYWTRGQVNACTSRTPLI